MIRAILACHKASALVKLPVVAVADDLILPTPSAPMDLAVLIETLREAIALVGVTHRVLLTRLDSRSRWEMFEAHQTPRKLGVPAFHSFIRAYQVHKRAAFEGILINQLRGENAREAKVDYCRVADKLQRDWRS